MCECLTVQASLDLLRLYLGPWTKQIFFWLTIKTLKPSEIIMINQITYRIHKIKDHLWKQPDQVFPRYSEMNRIKTLCNRYWIYDCWFQNSIWRVPSSNGVPANNREIWWTIFLFLIKITVSVWECVESFRLSARTFKILNWLTHDHLKCLLHQ